MNKLYFALLFALGSCSLPSINPFKWGSGSEPSAPEPLPPDVVTETVNFWLDMFLRFGWFLLVLALLFPRVRRGVTDLFTTIFQVLTIPFEFARLRWELYLERKRNS